MEGLNGGRCIKHLSGRKGIDDGVYTGWDDPRLGTLRAISKRGIKKETLKS